MTPLFVLRFDRGAPGAQVKAGAFLAWENGAMRPCASSDLATQYQRQEAASSVALRAAMAFPGAKLSVVPVLQ